MTMRGAWLWTLLLAACGGPAAPADAAVDGGAGLDGGDAATDAGSDAATDADVPSSIVLFAGGRAPYPTYRIPALVTTRAGTLLAFAEGRQSIADDGDIDIVLRRSEDGGATWSDVAVVIDAGADTAGNPSPIVLAGSVRVWLVYCTNPGADATRRSVWLTSSDDDGRSWAMPRDLTAMLVPAGSTWFATGPGRGIELSNGRLLVPCNGTDAAGVHRAFVVFSDDGGATWQRSNGADVGTDESTAAELPDGRVMLDMRFEGGTHARAVAFSSDHGTTFGPTTFDTTRPDPACEGSLLAVPEGLLFSNPATTVPVPRNHVTVRLSTDQGASWAYAHELDPGPSAYTALTRLSDGRFAIAWESGRLLPYDGIRFAVFDRAWLVR